MLGDRCVMDGEFCIDECGLVFIFISDIGGGGAIGVEFTIGTSGSSLILVLRERGSMMGAGASDPDKLRSRGSMLMKLSIDDGGGAEGI